VSRWDPHPGVRSDRDLTRGERAADRMRNGMGSWGFVFGFLAAMAVWAVLNTWVLPHLGGRGFDPFPYILLNLLLSTLAGLQGGILLIAAKRADQISSELAQHDYEADVAVHTLVTELHRDFAVLQTQHAEQGRQLAELHTLLVRRPL
jgi:uncharacterized membrane protein